MSDKPKHTPGPYFIEKKNLIVDGNKRPICLVWIPGFECPNREREEQESTANAALLSAAPDLIKAATKALGIVRSVMITQAREWRAENDHAEQQPTSDAWLYSRAVELSLVEAIKKAEGRA